jgi:hypothetical protein
MLKCPVCGKDICSCYGWGNDYIAHLKSCGDQWEQGKRFAWRGFYQYCHYNRFAHYDLVNSEGKVCGNASGPQACLYYQYHKDRWYKINKEEIEEAYKKDINTAVVCCFENCPMVAEGHKTPPAPGLDSLKGGK